MILRLRNMTAIDGTGLRAFEDLADASRATGRTLILCGAREQPAAVMQAGAIPRAHRRTEHLPEHRRGYQARRRGSTRARGV